MAQLARVLNVLHYLVVFVMLLPMPGSAILKHQTLSVPFYLVAIIAANLFPVLCFAISLAALQEIQLQLNPGALQRQGGIINQHLPKKLGGLEVKGICF